MGSVNIELSQMQCLVCKDFTWNERWTEELKIVSSSTSHSLFEVKFINWGFLTEFMKNCPENVQKRLDRENFPTEK